MSLDRILALIPHRPPMLLLDEIVTETDRSIVCAKTFRGEEYFFQGHYPNFPLVPGVILLESCCQAGAVLVAQIIGQEPKAGDSKFGSGNSASLVPVLTRVDNAKFKRMVRPGDRVLLEAEVAEVVSKAIYLKGRIKLQEKLAVSFDFVCSLADPSSVA